MLNEGVKRGLVQAGKGSKGCTPPFYWAAFALTGDWR
jgi:hypothetical protein